MPIGKGNEGGERWKKGRENKQEKKDKTETKLVNKEGRRGRGRVREWGRGVELSHVLNDENERYVYSNVPIDLINKNSFSTPSILRIF